MAQQTAFGLTSLYDPSIAVDQAALDRNTAMAQMLRQQAMSPLDTSGRMAGNMATRISPLEGLAKMLQAYSASGRDRANDQSRLILAQKQAAALGPMFDKMFGEGASTSAPAGLPGGVSPQAMESGGFPQPKTSQETQGERLQRSAKAAFLMGNTELSNKLIANYLELTPEQKNMAAKGQDPVQMGRLETQKATKEANAPTRLGNGAYGDWQGNIKGLPSQIPGSINIPSSAPGGWQTVPVPGSTEAIEAEQRAKGFGGAAATPYAGVDASGKPLPVQSVADVLRPGQVPPAVQGRRDVDRRAILEAELAREPDPKNRAAIQTELNAMGNGQAYPLASKPGVYAAPPLGTEHAQVGLDKSWEALKTQNREAQNTRSYLQNIVTAAEKGAIVGPAADRREMIQGMLQLAGIKEQVNTDAVSQKQLLDKYTNQIVTRLGQGGLGTDAARAMLESAYPNSKMNIDAIREASANLVGAQEMTQAKIRFLTDSAVKRDSETYQRREIAFDQAADPRIWQYKALKDPQARKAFAQTVLQQDPTFPERIKKLEELGAL